MENTLNCEKSIQIQHISVNNRTNEKNSCLATFRQKPKQFFDSISSYSIDWDLQGGDLNQREGERGNSSQSWSKIQT
jgi:hypothetical protein